MLSVDTGFKMHVFGGSTTGTTGQTDRLPGFYDITAPNQILTVMAINGFQPVRMTDYYQISVCIIRFRHPYHPVKSSTNRIISTSLDICPRMSPTSTISRNDLTTRQRESIFMLLQRVQMQVYMITFNKQSGSSHTDMVYLPERKRGFVLCVRNHRKE